MSTEFPKINAVVTLRVADEGDKRIWVTETPNDVHRLVETGKPLIKLTRVKSMGTVEFLTQPNNIVNVETSA